MGFIHYNDNIIIPKIILKIAIKKGIGSYWILIEFESYTCCIQKMIFTSYRIWDYSKLHWT